MRDDRRVSAMDDYLDDLQPAEKVALVRVRAVVAGLAPDAEEGTSYGVPRSSTPGARCSDSAPRRST